MAGAVTDALPNLAERIDALSVIPGGVALVLVGVIAVKRFGAPPPD